MSSWPTGSIPSTHIDHPTKGPDQWRSDLVSLVSKFNDMIGARGQASGVASLDGSSEVPASELAKALLKTGGTMTGYITLHADPDAALKAATKQYVDAQVAAAQPFDSGIKMLFRNLTVSGWTKDTAFNEHGVRIVTGGTLSSGGATNLTTVFGSGKSTSSHTLTESQIPSHTHTTDSQGAHTHGVRHSHSETGTGTILHEISPVDVAPSFEETDIPTQSNGAHTHTAQATGGGGSHSHNLSLDLKYCDFALFVKD